MSDTTNASGLLVVAGTDTEIGKTTVACALLAAWSDQGREVRGIKPVESGTAEQVDRGDEDGRRLARAAGQDEPIEALQRLKAPLAPPVAARDEGVELEPDRWFETIRDIAGDAEITLVEGAGGLLSPLADGVDTRTTAHELDASVILVASDSLGTLNHTFLTMEALQRSGVEVVGVAFSAPETSDASTGRNAEVVASRFPELPVVSLPRLTTVDERAKALSDSGFCDAVMD